MPLPPPPTRALTRRHDAPASHVAPGPLHLLLPAAGAQGEALAQALPGLALPQLQRLLNSLAPADRLRTEDTDPAMPHELALAQALGWPQAAGHLPWAAWESQTWGPPCAWVRPCHWQVGTDRILMGDPGALQLGEAESQALLAAMAPYFAEDGITLTHGQTPGAWLATGEVFRDLPTASLERVVGRNINAWLPDAATPTGAALRRLQNEMQMLLYTHPLNDAREQRGQPVVNSFWLTGAGVLPNDVSPPPGLAIDDRLAAPALRGDAAAWAAAWRALDAGPVAGLLQAHNQGQAVRLTLCGERVAQSWVSPPAGLWPRLRRALTAPFSRRTVASQLEAL